MIHLGKVARYLRESYGLTQQELADAIGVTNVHVSNIENEKAAPSQQIIDRYREKFGVDLYILAWCQYGDLEKLPFAIRKPATDLAKAWKQRLGSVLEKHAKSED